MKYIRGIKDTGIGVGREIQGVFIEKEPEGISGNCAVAQWIKPQHPSNGVLAAVPAMLFPV